MNRADFEARATRIFDRIENLERVKEAILEYERDLHGSNLPHYRLYEVVEELQELLVQQEDYLHEYFAITNRIALREALEPAYREHVANRRPCFPKRQFPSEEKAGALAKQLVDRGIAGDVVNLKVYRCSLCGKWHVGHIKRGRT